MISNSSSALSTRGIASSRVRAVMMIFPIMESNLGETVLPSATPKSIRMPGPEGKWRCSMVPEPGVRFFCGSSLVIRSSKLCPRGSPAWVSSLPSAILSCSRTRSIPHTSSLTVCSTCRRGLTSRKYTSLVGVTMNSQVPRPSYPTESKSLREYVIRRACTLSLRKGAGASSMSFWFLRCTEQSRVEYTVKFPSESRPHCVSTCRAWATNFSMKYLPRSLPWRESWAE